MSTEVRSLVAAAAVSAWMERHRVQDEEDDRALCEWRVFHAERRAKLAAVFDERGIDVCQVRHHEGNTIEQRLGIFPRDQIHMFYAFEGPEAKRNRIDTYCSTHIAYPLNTVWRFDDEDDISFTSEVVEKDGRFITEIRGIDVTREVNSREYHEDVYQQMGLPPLPVNP